MNDIIRFQKSIEASFRRTKFLTGMTILLCSLVAVVSVFASYSFAREQKAQIYVLDKGQSFLALQSDGMATKDLEIIDHVTRFHELFFNMAPNANAIIQNVNRALVLSDKSVYDYYSDLSEQGFYARLVQANITQQMVVDSVKVDIGTYPYTARCYAHQYMIRESNITTYEFESTCQLLETTRSKDNPHGLMIEKFVVVRNESLGTKKRK